MTIRWLTRTLARSAHFLCRLLSEFHDYPSAEIYSRRFNPFYTSSISRLDPPSFDTYTPVTLSGSTRFHGESLGQTQEPAFLRANHTDSLLGPPFISESVQSGNSGVATRMTRVDGVTTPDLRTSHISEGHTSLTRAALWRSCYEPWPLLCIGWERPLHDEVTETWAVVHSKLLWS